MEFKRSLSVDTCHLKIVIYNYIWLILILSKGMQSHARILGFYDKNIPWTHNSIVYTRNFYNIKEHERLEKRSISRYTYENTVNSGKVPKFTYILPTNATRANSKTMQIDRKTEIFKENVEYASIVDHFSITTLNESENSTEKYGYYEEYSMKNSLNEEDMKYMNEILSYYDQYPNKNLSFGYDDRHKTAKDIESYSTRNKQIYSKKLTYNKPIQNDMITKSIMKLDNLFKSFSNKIERIVTGEDPAKTVSNRIGGPLITSHVVTTSIHPWIFPLLHTISEPYMSYAVFIIITIVEFLGIILGYKLEFLGIRATDPPPQSYVKASSVTIIDLCAGVFCNFGETCTEGICKCGSIATCAGVTSGEYCDADNNVCKCSATVAACSDTSDTCIAGICKCGTSDACSNAGETCSSGSCKCGSASTCVGQASGSFCDAANNVCKCSSTVAACSGTSDTCTSGVCKCGSADACSNSGELCTSGSCKCGTSSTCVGKTTGSYCDAANNLCKCSASVDSCSGSSDTCTAGVCKCGSADACSGTTDTCTNGVCKCGSSDACSISGETCSSGSCKCGTSSSCAGLTTGSYCDAANNVCKCSETVNACSGTSDTCTNGVCKCGSGDACSISGETCVSGTCMCGTASSCAGVTSGSYCDAANNVCKCSATVDACSGTTDTCTSGVCKCGSNDACSNSGETCSSGVCKCGSADTCVGQITGAYCDAANNVCKCSATVDKCQSGEECSGGTCVCK